MGGAGSDWIINKWIVKCRPASDVASSEKDDRPSWLMNGNWQWRRKDDGEDKNSRNWGDEKERKEYWKRRTTWPFAPTRNGGHFDNALCLSFWTSPRAIAYAACTKQFHTVNFQRQNEKNGANSLIYVCMNGNIFFNTSVCYWSCLRQAYLQPEWDSIPSFKWLLLHGSHQFEDRHAWWFV